MPTETRVLRTLDLDACEPETVGIPHALSIRRGSFPEACSETSTGALTLYTAEPLLDTMGQVVYADSGLTTFPTDGYYKLPDGLIISIIGSGVVEGFLTCP